VVKPVFKNQLQGTVTFPDGTVQTLNVPRTDLDWTAGARIEGGYKLPDSFGEFLIAWRFLDTDGRQTLATDQGDVGVHSRLNLNVFDLDYNSARYSPEPRLDLRWTVGIRLASVFYDTSIANDAISQSASNYFYGAGPHAAFEVERQVGFLPSFGFFAKGDASVLFGDIKQHFSSTTTDALGNETTAFFGDRKTQSVEVLSLRAGISFQPPNMEFLRFTLGYEYEHWFSVGRLGDSHGELTTQGVFLRGQFDF
jgi:hypothetical protein